MNKEQRKRQAQRVIDSREYMYKLLRENKKLVSTRLERMNREGTCAHLHVYMVVDGETMCITGSVATIIGARRDKDGLIMIRGTGLDRGGQIVDCLGWKLYQNQYIIKHARL